MHNNQDSEASDETSEHTQRAVTGDPQLASPERSKRQTVASACQLCRQRKTKCDGQRPCQACQRRGTQCAYTTHENETQKQAAKRKHDEVSQARDDLDELYQLIGARSEPDAFAIFQRIRRGESLGAVLKFAKLGETPDATLMRGYQQQITQDFLTTTAQERQVRQDFVLHLVKSTVPLQIVLKIAAPFVGSESTLKLPSAEVFESFRDRLLDQETLEGIVKDANPQRHSPDELDSRPSTASPPSDGSYDGPIFWVPAAPWTTLTTSDAAVSHLVSLFLTFINVSWRLVEEDLFLQGMRSGNRDSPYCSDVLVNAMLSYASMFSEIEEAYSSTGDPMTRGLHFHQEAIRLWEQVDNDGKESLRHLQAKMILTQESSYRGKDKLALHFMSIAAEINKKLPQPVITQDSPMAERDYARARRTIAWTAVYTDIQYVWALFKPASGLSVGLDDAPDASELLPDTVTYWTGYPFKRDPLPLRKNLLFLERCTLTRFQYELVDLLRAKKHKPGDPGVWKEVKAFADRFRSWYDGLPSDIAYSKNMPVPLFELHGEFTYVMMTLYKQTLESVYGDMTDVEDDEVIKSDSTDDLRSEITAQVLMYAYRAATTVRDYRETYGMKVHTPHLVKQATLTAFILLQDLRLNPHSSRTLPKPHVDIPFPESRSSLIQDTRAAFEECFRCLLAGGTQVMILQGITRMVVQTATILKVALPRDVTKMLSLLAQTVWTASDLEQLRSTPEHDKDGSSTGPAKDNDMDGLMHKWEGLGILDRAMGREGDEAPSA